MDKNNLDTWENQILEQEENQIEEEDVDVAEPEAEAEDVEAAEPEILWDDFFYAYVLCIGTYCGIYCHLEYYLNQSDSQ